MRAPPTRHATVMATHRTHRWAFAQTLVPFGGADFLRAFRQAFEYFGKGPGAQGDVRALNAEMKAVLSFDRPVDCARAPTPTAAPGA